MSSIMCMCKDWILEFFYLILIWGMGVILILIEVLLLIIVVIVMLVRVGVYGMLLMILSIYK